MPIVFLPWKQLSRIYYSVAGKKRKMLTKLGIEFLVELFFLKEQELIRPQVGSSNLILKDRI